MINPKQPYIDFFFKHNIKAIKSPFKIRALNLEQAEEYLAKILSAIYNIERIPYSQGPFEIIVWGCIYDIKIDGYEVKLKLDARKGFDISIKKQ